MAESKKAKEEYRLPEEENLESHHERDGFQFSDTKEKPSYSAKDILLNKKIWMPFALILGVYGIYKFMEFRDKQQLKVQQGAEVPALKAPPASSTQTAQNNAPLAISEQEMALKQGLQAAVDQANRHQVQLESFGSQMNQMQLTQTQMKTELSELSEAVKALTAKLGESKLPEPEKPKAPRRIRKYYRRPVAVAPRYHLRAVIPGRAWVESTSGRLFTVRVGESIIGYGVVEEINVTKGSILTSSGREITYGRNDS